MRIRTLLLVATLPLAACGTGYPVYDIPGVSFGPPVSEGLQDVAFLEGCWRGGEVNGPTSEEHFSIPGAGTMLGWSRTSRNGRLGAWEFQRVVDEVNALVLEVWPNGEKSPARFVLTDLEPGALAAFEDPGHDYPKRIRYQLIQDDLMQVTVDGGPSGQGDVLQLTMARIDCGTE
jgi:hypothetical protein